MSTAWMGLFIKLSTQKGLRFKLLNITVPIDNRPAYNKDNYRGLPSKRGCMSGLDQLS